MTLEKTLAGLLIMLLKIDGAIIWWKFVGFELWQTFLIILCWTSITMIFTFMGMAGIKSWVKRRKFFKKISGKFQNWHWQKNFRKKNVIQRTKIVNWVSRQKNWVIIGLGFIPFVPYLPTTVIVTTKLLEIRFGLAFLLVGNTFRIGFICSFLYGFLEIITKIFSLNTALLIQLSNAVFLNNKTHYQ